MLRTKLLAFAGLVLTLSSLLYGTGFWGYQRAVMLLQLGGISFVLGMFYRIVGSPRQNDSGLVPLARLYDLETGLQ